MSVCCTTIRGMDAHLSRPTRCGAHVLCPCSAACRSGETVALGAEPVTISLLDYTYDMDCKWVVSGMPPIELSFTVFDLTERFDYVKVYEGSNTGGKMLKEYSGSSLPPPLLVKVARMTLAFSSIVSGNGFVAVLKPALGTPRLCFPTPELRLHERVQVC
jgi:hypothetical protein